VSILERIFETKRQEVAAAKTSVSLAQLEDLAKAQPLLPFRNTLKSSPHPVALIAEVKKASPSKGVIREDFEPLEIAKIYQKAGADCLSVLTDEQYFQGAPENLQRIKKDLSIPCLRKDFIYHEYQVFQARAWGADAVLLIAASLESNQIQDLRTQIEALGMDAFLEVHDERECEIAIEQNFQFVGVNNRNLKDFKTDVSTSERLIPVLKSGLPEAVIVSESALETKADIDRAQAAGARSVLIGTTFCAAPDIGGKVKDVMGW
jgi:indole-3-glycerol phosphate synthase